MKVCIVFIAIFSAVLASKLICDGDLKCANNGVCRATSMPEGAIETECVCGSQFTGARCEYRRCPTDPCHNGGICEFFGRSFKCHCSTGFGGDFCEDKISSACDAVECGVHGTCRLREEEGGQEAECVCAPGFTGLRCDKHDFCHPNPCSHNSACFSFSSGFVCACRRGFTGDQCEIDEDDCRNHKCAPGSVCVDLPGAYVCRCPADRVGVFCELPNPCLRAGAEELCGRHGYCFSTFDGEATCLCDPGWQGVRCQHDVDECLLNAAVCGPHGTCVNKPGGYDCECENGMDGPGCTTPVATDPHPRWRMACLAGAGCVFACTILLLFYLVCCDSR